MSSEFKESFERMYREGTAPWDTGEPCREVVRRLPELPATGSALDLGCGSGVHSLQLAGHGLDVVGVDLSEVAIAAARQRAAAHAAARRVRFIAGDLTELRGIGEPFDVLLDRGCYHLMRGENLAGFLGALERLSGPGTVLFLLAFSSDEPPEFPNLPRVSERELRDELGGLFDVTDLQTCRLEKPLGFEREPLFWSVMLERR